MRTIRLLSRIALGLLFIFSGFVKSVDPLGSTYKFIDYFVAFGMPWAEAIAFPLAIIMSTAEFLIGLTLFFNIKMKISAWSALLFMAFFTPLTLYLAIDDPVSDCGCFGDALILTNWETFFKNLIILVPTLIVFYGRKSFKPILINKVQWLIVSVFTITIFGFSFYCINHLPTVDFRPYAIGTHINADMKEISDLDENIPAEKAVLDKIPEKDRYDISKITYYCKNLKTDEIKEFYDSYPWEDTLNWKLIDNKSEIIKKGYHPPIHDFTIDSYEDGDITDLILENENYNFLLISYNIEKACTDNQETINKLAEYCSIENINFISVTSSNYDIVEKFKNKNNVSYKFATADEITLKTIIRSNPGLVLLKKGTIIGKWSDGDIPSITYFKENILK